MFREFQVIRLGVKTNSQRKQEGNGKSPIIKQEYDSIRITTNGCKGIDMDKEFTDYNHYRTVSRTLKGTNNRAISLVTRDVYDNLQNLNKNLNFGDFGENLTIEGIKYNDLYKDAILCINEVILQITEACIPCARLSYLDENPKWWNKKNNTEISRFINNEGGRGWYAKVLQPGII